MPKFQKTVRMLFASCTPERSASERPRRDGGTTCARAMNGDTADAARATTIARRLISVASLGTKRHADFDPSRRIEARRVRERHLVGRGEARVVGAARRAEHAAVVETL